MVVGVCGYGYSGSGAILDLLKEYKECSLGNQVEFEILTCPGGILDLEFHLINCINKFESSDAALLQFNKIINVSRRRKSAFYTLTNGKFYELSKEYFDSICQLKWEGLVSYDHYLYNRTQIFWRFSILSRLNVFYKLIRKKDLPGYKRNMYMSIYPNDFYETTKKYIISLMLSSGFDLENICVLNQPFAANNIIAGMRYFNDSKAIVVDRDPRDIYIFVKEIVSDSGSFIPVNSVEDFVKYYRLLRIKKEIQENILYLNFEDLIFKYDLIVKKIENFLEIKNHQNKERYFRPEVSAANTMLFIKFPKYNRDIQYIEHELPEYLYPFSEEMRKLIKGEPHDC